MNRTARIAVLAALFAAALVTPARADLAEIGPLTGENAKGYLGPLNKALASTLNSAIFVSGRVPTAGIQVSFGVKAMGVTFDKSDRTFVPVDPPGFTSTAPTPVSTVVGDGNSVAVPGQGGTAFNFPGGFDISQFVIPAPELTVGNVLGTRATVRWFSAKLGDSDLGKIELFGIGAQHSLNRYMQGLPVDLALGGFYQTLKLGDGLLDTKALHVDITGSRSFGHFVTLQPFASIGYDTFSMDVSYKTTTTPVEQIAVSMDKLSNAHFTAGAQLGLPGVTLHGEFDAAARNGASLGVMFGF